MIAEYERRVRRFESPIKVARDLGYSLEGLRVAAARFKSKPNPTQQEHE